MSEQVNRYFVATKGHCRKSREWTTLRGEVVAASDYDALAQRCRELEAQLAQRDEAIEEWSGTAVQNGMECDTLRAEVADLQARLLDAERGAEELVRVRANERDLVAALSRIYVRAKGYANENREMPEGSTFVVAEIAGKALEAAACASTDGATPAP